MPQDMPPVGGYGPVQYKRNLPVRGFRPAVYIFGTIAIVSFGFYIYGIGVRERKCVLTIGVPPRVYAHGNTWLTLARLRASRLQ